MIQVSDLPVRFRERKVLNWLLSALCRKLQTSESNLNTKKFEKDKCVEVLMLR